MSGHSSLWDWPTVDSPVEVHGLIVEEWCHDGDSPMALTRPRKRASLLVPPPTYLLKWGRDALGERIYSLVARLLDLPSMVVYWTSMAEFPEVALRFESAAWRPDKIEAESGRALGAERAVELKNPLDYFRHLALGGVLEDIDGPEFLVQENVLFRIDAAACGSTFVAYTHRICGGGFGAVQPHLPSVDEHRLTLLSVQSEALARQQSSGYQMYQDTLMQLAEWSELPDLVARDLLACPAARGVHISKKHRWLVLPFSLSEVAEATATYLHLQQKALKNWLAEQG